VPAYSKNEIGALSVAEKVELIDQLWESLETDALPLAETQRAELDRRVTRYAQDPTDVIPWEQIRADLLKKR
jgi:putative addiction module component (TIGR02574 family)